MEEKLPFFSVIIPTYRRPRQLAACLRSLGSLDYPAARFEVVVVDDGSGAPSESTVAQFRDRLDVTLITQPHAGPATARNTGAARAKGQFLAFTDDDCTPAHDWLRALAAHFAAAPDHAIGGRTLNVFTDNVYSTASQSLLAYLYGYYNADADHARFFASNNLALSRDRFRAVGGFDTGSPLAAGEDRELCDRWLHHGYQMSYAPEAVVAHAHPLTLRTFWRQHFTYGRGAFFFHQARALRSQRRMRPEPWAFYLDLLRYPFSQASPQPASFLAALLVLSQIANAAGFLSETMRFQRARVGVATGGIHAR